MTTTVPSPDALPAPVDLAGELDDYTAVALGWHKALHAPKLPQNVGQSKSRK